MHEIFFHLLKTSNNWRQGIETGKRSYSLNAGDFPTLASIQAGLLKEQAAWQAILDSLRAEDVEGDVTITRRSGEVEYVPRWRIPHHLVLHGMQHHAELALMLTQKGKPPGDNDFIFYR